MRRAWWRQSARTCVGCGTATRCSASAGGVRWVRMRRGGQGGAQAGEPYLRPGAAVVSGGGNRRPEVLLPAVPGLYGPVRGCPQDRRHGGPGARTYSGQRRGRGYLARSFQQVRAYVEVQVVAVCKTVGSAYVGSNPTPATTCGNGPLAAETRLWGPFLLVTPCIRVCHCGSVCCGVHGCIADGVRAVRTVGAHRRLFYGRPRTGRVGGVFRLDVRR
jgi:hypothetical protein